MSGNDMLMNINLMPLITHSNDTLANESFLGVFVTGGRQNPVGAEVQEYWEHWL